MCSYGAGPAPAAALKAQSRENAIVPTVKRVPMSVWFLIRLPPRVWQFERNAL